MAGVVTRFPRGGSEPPALACPRCGNGAEIEEIQRVRGGIGDCQGLEAFFWWSVGVSSREKVSVSSENVCECECVSEREGEAQAGTLDKRYDVKLCCGVKGLVQQ